MDEYGRAEWELARDDQAFRRRLKHADSGSKQIEKAMEPKTLLSQILLDSIPCVALLVRPGTREIVASNRAATQVGAVPGETCYQTWGQRDTPCPWCLAPDLWVYEPATTR